MMNTYDIIFAGGGAAACVAAGRLAAADPTLKILVLEAGLHTKDVPQHIQPARFMNMLRTRSNAFTYNEGRPTEALLGRAPIVPCGRAVGGGSSVNFMVYNRASASDYDAWETTYGNRGWGSDNLIPLLKKAETYQGESTSDTHGTEGPIKVSFSNEYNNVGVNFLEVTGAYDKDRSLTDDINTFTSCDQYGRWARYIDIKTGRRSDTAHAYIYNQSHNTNLTVQDKSRVIRVIFENGRAVGVEYIGEGDGASHPRSVIVKASRLVVLSAGAFGSPTILERSGIGSEKVLDENGISQIVDLQGVGEHYMDHVLLIPQYHGSEETESLDRLMRGDGAERDVHEAQWLKDGSGLLSQNGIDALGKIRPTARELKMMSPEFDHRWKTFFAEYPDKPVVAVCSISGYAGVDPAVSIGKYFGVGAFLAYPLATGHVHITSGLDPHGNLDFHPGYMDELADVVGLRWIYKKLREHARRMKYYRGEVLSSHPKFPKGSAAETRSSDMPVEISTPDIVYTKEDDEAIDQFNRGIGAATAWHSCGTCAMKPRDQGGVVDERLNVYGVKNLKVADISIMPENVSSNTYNTAIAIGEKAAVIIAQDLGIKGVTEF